MSSAFIAYLLLFLHLFGAITVLPKDTSSNDILPDNKTEVIQKEGMLVYSNAVHHSENCLQVSVQEYTACGDVDLFIGPYTFKNSNKSSVLLYLDQSEFILPALSSRVIIYPFHSFP
jgi:hypothetical protein